MVNADSVVCCDEEWVQCPLHVIGSVMIRYDIKMRENPIDMTSRLQNDASVFEIFGKNQETAGVSKRRHTENVQ